MNLTATVLPTAESTADLLAVPWTSVPVACQPYVDFSAIRMVDPGRASGPQQLVHPWDDARFDAPAAQPVSFLSLAAPCRPVLPSQRQPAAPIAE